MNENEIKPEQIKEVSINNKIKISEIEITKTLIKNNCQKIVDGINKLKDYDGKRSTQVSEQKMELDESEKQKYYDKTKKTFKVWSIEGIENKYLLCTSDIKDEISRLETLLSEMKGLLNNLEATADELDGIISEINQTAEDAANGATANIDWGTILFATTAATKGAEDEFSAQNGTGNGIDEKNKELYNAPLRFTKASDYLSEGNPGRDTDSYLIEKWDGTKWVAMKWIPKESMKEVVTEYNKRTEISSATDIDKAKWEQRDLKSREERTEIDLNGVETGLAGGAFLRGAKINQGVSEIYTFDSEEGKFKPQNDIHAKNEDEEEMPTEEAIYDENNKSFYYRNTDNKGITTTTDLSGNITKEQSTDFEIIYNNNNGTYTVKDKNGQYLYNGNKANNETISINKDGVKIETPNDIFAFQMHNDVVQKMHKEK